MPGPRARVLPRLDQTARTQGIASVYSHPMTHPATPGNESQRMAALREMDVLFTPAEERYDRITRMAARVFDTPIVLVSLVAEKCQWFKSAQGLEIRETSREISFCGHTILGEATLVVENATEDARFAGNPLVLGAEHFRFYAGHPLHAADGSRVGTFCVIDRSPRSFSPTHREMLRDLAAITEAELQRGQLSASQRALTKERDELRLRASTDGLTHLWNRAAILDLMGSELARTRRGTPTCVAMIDADHFKAINDSHGHLTGDAVLVEIAARIRRAVREFDAAGRYGGEEFIAVLSDCTLAAAREVCERIRGYVADQPVQTPAGPISVTVSIGLAPCDSEFASVEHVIAAADAAMYRAKKNGRNRVEVKNTRAL